MEWPANFFPQVLGFLLQDCPAVRTEPEAEPVKERPWTSYGEFFVQLHRQVQDGLALAKSRVDQWARTGQAPQLTGAASFVLVTSIRAVGQETGISYPLGEIEGDLPGPPWAEEIAGEITRLLFGEASAKALAAWMDKTAQDCFRSQPWGR